MTVSSCRNSDQNIRKASQSLIVAGFQLANACSWDYESFVQPDIKAEDEDSYARHMWEEMQRKRSLYQQPSAATADTWGKADSTQARRQKAAKDAADNSRRILEEEQARDRAWRQAVSQVLSRSLVMCVTIPVYSQINDMFG